MTSKEMAMVMVKDWNDRIDRFMEETLPVLLSADGYQVKDGMVPLDAWFAAQRHINAQNFDEAGHHLQMMLRNDGHDVKMNMQSNKLVF